VIKPVSEFYADAAGRLPNLAFVDPMFLDGGGGNGSGDEHPHGDIRIGQAFMSDVVHAFISSPQFRRGAMFINYDEWGDSSTTSRRGSCRMTGRARISTRTPHHRAADPRRRDLPHARRGHVNHMTVTHESIPSWSPTGRSRLPEQAPPLPPTSAAPSTGSTSISIRRRPGSRAPVTTPCSPLSGLPAGAE
jgi:phospholipase C